MAEDIIYAIDYFSTSEDYFWHWAEHGRVIEFANNKTICYREELTYLLGELPAETRFPFGSILLLLCACKDNWEAIFEGEQQLMRVSLVPGFNSADYLQTEKLKNDAYAFLKVVNSLPATDRSGIKRTALISAIISTLPVNEQLPEIKSLVKNLNSGELDFRIRSRRKKLTFETILADLSPLAEAFRFFPDAEPLGLKLKTGLLFVPTKAPVALPEDEGLDLLGQLENDIQTRMLGALARKILAAVRIPMHLSGSSDFALGGVADIGNRGNFDQLLLSELAQDDMLLTARLANNEALYLKRETPPNNTVEELGIFIDLSLKMWGMPRILSLATALAFRESKLKNQQLKVWGVGKTSVELDLNSKKGIIEALELLDPSLHCGEQLTKTIRQQANNKGKYILITSEQFFQDPVTAVYFHRIREHLNFIATVNRNGHIQLIRLSKGRQQLLNEATISLDDLVYRATKNNRKQLRVSGVPAIMQEDDFPLYYPTSKVKMVQDNTYVTSARYVIIITQDRRVLCWRDKNKGAIELLDCLPQGSFCFGEFNSDIFLLINSAKAEAIKVYCFKSGLESAELYEIEPRQHTGYAIKFIDGQFFLMGSKGLDVLDLDTMQLNKGNEEEEGRFKSQPKMIQHYKNFNLLKKQINNGYSVINSIKTIYVNPATGLFLDKRQLNLKGNNLFWLEGGVPTLDWIRPTKIQHVNMEHLPNIKFTKYTWKGGSEMLMDSRGVLHLKSYNTDIPEISILLVVDQATACWCADGVVSGLSYFTGKTTANQTEPSIFYKNYIQRFITTLI